MKHQLRIIHRVRIVADRLDYWMKRIEAAQASFAFGYPTEKAAKDRASQLCPKWNRLHQEMDDFFISKGFVEGFLSDPDMKPSSFEHALALLEIYGEKLCTGYALAKALLICSPVKISEDNQHGA